MKSEYRREMEQLGPRSGELERLYTMIEGGAEMKKTRKLGRRAAAAILACAALTLTAAAKAAPAVWEALQAQLGAFAPYAQTVEGAVCADQGVELQVLSAVADDLEARVYLAVRDVEEDRLNEFLTLNGELKAGEAVEPEREIYVSMVGGYSTDNFKLLSYDPETKTALFCSTIYYLDTSRPNGEAELSVIGMSTRQGQMYASASCASVTGETLKSLPAGEDDRVILSPSDVEGTGYTDDILPSERVVLAPGQTPMDVEGTEDVRISSMGFASDDRFHIRLEFAEGVEPAVDGLSGHSTLYADLLAQCPDGSAPMKYFVSQVTLVEGGMDILLPLLTVDDLDGVRGSEARVYGIYTRPGTDIEGSWSTEFELDYYPSAALDWTGELAGWQVREVTLSPLSVTISGSAPSDDNSSISQATLYAVKKDGSTVAARPAPSTFANLGAAHDSGEGWDMYATWRFEEPVDLEDVASLTLGDAVIPVN